MNFQSYGLPLILNEENWFSKFLNFNLKKTKEKLQDTQIKSKSLAFFLIFNLRQSPKSNKSVRKMISKKSSFGKKLCGNIHLTAKRIGVEKHK